MTFIIGVAAGLLVSIIVSSVRDYFSPTEKEIREICKAVLNMEKNLEEFMKAEGHEFEKYDIKPVTTPYDELLENAGEKYDEWSEVTSEGINRNAEIQWEATRERNELIKNLLDSFMEKLEEHFEKYPLPSVPVVKMNEGDEYTDVTNMEHTGGGAAISTSATIIMNAVLGALPGVINTAFENNVPAALENAVQSVIGKTAEETGIGTLGTGEENQNLLLNIEEMKNMLIQMASQGGDEGLADAIATKMLEKTGGTVDGEGQMTKEEMIGAMVEGMEEVPEQYKEIRRIVERNQTLIYSYQDQLLRLEHMIQTRALTFDQIYRKVIKKMWDDYRCGG